MGFLIFLSYFPFWLSEINQSVEEVYFVNCMNIPQNQLYTSVLTYTTQVVQSSNEMFISVASTGKRLCSLRSVDGSNITSYSLHECDSSTRTRMRRYILTGMSSFDNLSVLLINQLKNIINVFQNHVTGSVSGSCFITALTGGRGVNGYVLQGKYHFL